MPAPLNILLLAALEHADPVSALFLGDIACVVGRGEHRVDVLVPFAERDYADAERYREKALLPDEFMVLDGILKPFRDVEGILQGTVTKYDREFVPAQARREIPSLGK